MTLPLRQARAELLAVQLQQAQETIRALQAPREPTTAQDAPGEPTVSARVEPPQESTRPERLWWLRWLPAERVRAGWHACCGQVPMGNFTIVHVGSGKHLAEYASEPSALCAVRDVVLTRG